MQVPQHPPLPDSASRLIRRKARQLVGKAGLTTSDIPDLEQDLTLDLLQRYPKFDSNRASESTFIARLVDRKIANIIRYRTQQARDYRRGSTSISESVADGNGASVERAQTIGARGDRRFAQRTRSEVEFADLRHDVASVVADLPDELRSFARLLMRVSPAKVSRIFEIPRTTLYRNVIERLRAHFDHAGLAEYL